MPFGGARSKPDEDRATARRRRPTRKEPPVQQHYVLEGRSLLQVPQTESDISVFLAPDAAERGALVTFGIDAHSVDSSLDPEESARLQYDSESRSMSIIWKHPDARADADPMRFELATIGIFIRPDRVVLLTADDLSPFRPDLSQAKSRMEFVLRLMLASQQDFLERFRAIKHAARDIQTRLDRTLDNRELVRIFDLGKDLVYYVDAIDGNGAVLTRLQNASHRLSFTDEEVELLEDLVIDNEQLSRQGHIYTTLLRDLLDARGNIVSNTMNVLIKNLTVVSVVFLPLGVIASMGGMSEYSRFLEEQGITFPLGYAGFVVALILTGVVIYWFVRAWANRHMGGDQP
jgi:magnesium transporter